MQFSTWQQVYLHLLKEDGANSTDFYLLTNNKGTEQEERSRFLSYQEVLQVVRAKMIRVAR